MKKLLSIQLVVLLLCYCYQLEAQFTRIPYPTGVSFSTSAHPIHGPYARAGGGVVLRGKSRPLVNCPDCEITDATVTLTAHQIVLLSVSKDDGKAEFSMPCYIAKDAASLVKSETEEIYRNVNLLGNPTDAELAEITNSSDYFFVELSDALHQTKSGEVLIIADLIQADPFFYSKYNLDFYFNTNFITAQTNGGKGVSPNNSPNIKDVNKYKDIEERLGTPANWTWADENADYSFSINWKTRQLSLDGRPTFTYLADINNDLMLNLGRLIFNSQDTLEECIAEYASLTNNLNLVGDPTDHIYEKKIKNYAQTIFTTIMVKLYSASSQLDKVEDVISDPAAELVGGVRPIENTTKLLGNVMHIPINTSILVNEISNRLSEVQNQLTYTHNIYKVVSENPADLVLDDIATEYFKAYPIYIDNLNRQVFSNAVEFAKVAAFYRYLKFEKPDLWDKVYAATTNLPVSIGATPRLVKK